MRAREPDEVGDVDRDGVRIHYEVFGSGPVTVFLLPTWWIVPSAFWKLQVPYLARHVRVLVADPRGNGRSDRPTDTAAYADEELVLDALAVMDASRTPSAVAVGLSMGARVLLQLAVGHPDRIAGTVFVGPSMRLVERPPACWTPPFEGPFLGAHVAGGWGRFNADYWRRDLPDFARWFFGEVFTEPHSTKQIDDAVDWARGTDPEAMVAGERAPYLGRESASGTGVIAALARRLTCPSLVITGDEDRITPVEIAEVLAQEIGCPLEVVAGGGHCVNARHPVWFNHRLMRFVEEVGARARV